MFLLGLVFTFHYVSISTSLGLLLDRKRLYIYIPLCIYFNLSVFLLLLFFGQIYIPLCIYFNRTARATSGLSKHIYIPLCIYFNHFILQRKIIKICIYIPLCIYFNHLLLLISLMLLLHLHSTMYLFQR